MKHLMSLAGLSVAGLMLVSCNTQVKEANYQVIPLPQEISVMEQAAPFILSDGTKIMYPEGNERMQKNAEFLASYIKDLTGKSLSVQAGTEGRGILLQLGGSSENPEGYQLKVTDANVVISGPTEAGKGAVAEVSSYIDETILTASADGEVTEIFPKAGELVGTGAPIMNVARLNDMWVTFNVREDFLKDFTVGNEISAFIPAFDKEIKFKVTYMKDLGTYAAWKATKTTGQFDLKTFEVKAVPVERTDGLRPGMSAIIEK